MTTSSRWLGIGVLAAAVSLQVLVGATVAWAEPDTSPDSGQSVSGPSVAGTAAGVADKPGPTSESDDVRESEPADTKAVVTETDPESEPSREPTTEPETPAGEQQSGETSTSLPAETVVEDERVEPVTDSTDNTDNTDKRDRSVPQTVKEVRETPADRAVADDQMLAVTVDQTPAEPTGQTPAPAAAPSDAEVAVVNVDGAGATGVRTSRPEPARTDSVVMSASVATAAATGASIDIVGTIIAVVFSVITALEQWATGPATAPAGSTVTVRSSSLQLTDGLTVPADWYFPEPTETGEAPRQIIYLAHGFMAVGAMYSHTAARLAEDTNSIVVVPTVTSNPFAAGGLWINGAGLPPVVANLFAGDREALTASALAAGYAALYGLDPDAAELPGMFALAGHSAGGSMAMGTVNHLDADALADLAGVVLFDAVTGGTTASDALATLDSTGRFIPVREIGSPWNLWNFPSNINTSLTASRPEAFSGVVLDGGTHADSMAGASPVIQLALNLLVGTPLPQNADAVWELAATWLNSWFQGTDEELVPGSTVTGSTAVTIPTPSGPATGTVIGAAPVVTAARESDLAVAV